MKKPKGPPVRYVQEGVDPDLQKGRSMKTIKQSNQKIDNVLAYVCLGYLFFSIFACTTLAIKLHNSNKEIKILNSIIDSIKEQREVEYRQDTLIDISNWDNIKYYSVISIDQGKTWYYVNDKRKIIGNFDKLFPSLRKKINKQHEDLKKLTAYVDKNGPIGIRGEISEEEMQMLKNVGAASAQYKDSKKDTMMVGTALPKEY